MATADERDGRVRAAAEADLPRVLALYAQLHPTDGGLEPARARAAFREVVATPGLHLLVLEADVGILATAYANVIPNLTWSAAPTR